jgi:hypothetical protein
MDKNVIYRSLRTWFTGSHRHLKGAEPVPGAQECLLEYVSGRPNLGIENWTEQVRLSGFSAEIARFVFEFFDNRGVPIGKVRLDDRLEADLRSTKALPQKWADEFQKEFMDRFEVPRLFRPGPAPDTVGELLTFVQQELDDWRTGEAKR